MVQTLLSAFFKIPEKLRYLLVGGYNAAFAMVLYIALYWAISNHLNYLSILVLTHIISVTNSYASMKFFVFRTHGNIAREYIRCHLSYLLSLALNFALLYMAVDLAGASPVIAQPILTIVIALAMYVVHKNFSYKKQA